MSDRNFEKRMLEHRLAEIKAIEKKSNTLFQALIKDIALKMPVGASITLRRGEDGLDLHFTYYIGNKISMETGVHLVIYSFKDLGEKEYWCNWLRERVKKSDWKPGNYPSSLL